MVQEQKKFGTKKLDCYTNLSSLNFLSLLSVGTAGRAMARTQLRWLRNKPN